MNGGGNRQFSGNGGKLIFYHGNSDPWFSALDTVDYYERMTTANGGDDKVPKLPIVDVIHPQNNATDQELVLPGQTMPFTDTPVYARTNGYLKRWYVDMGAHVKKG